MNSFFSFKQVDQFMALASSDRKDYDYDENDHRENVILISYFHNFLVKGKSECLADCVSKWEFGQ